MNDNKEPYQKEVNKTKKKSSYKKWGFFMDNGLVIDNVIDTTASKLLDNVTLNNSHTTWNNSANRVPFSNKCLSATSNISETQLKTLTSNDTINVEHTLVKDSSQVPRNKSLKIFYQDI
jgi:hypothetical protein